MAATSTFDAITGAEPMASPYAIQSTAADACTRRSSAASLQKYEPAKRAVASQPSASSTALRVFGRAGGGRHAAPEGEDVGADLVPLLDLQPLALEEGPDAQRVPARDVLQQRDEDAERVVAQDGPASDRRQVLRLRHRDGVA